MFLKYGSFAPSSGYVPAPRQTTLEQARYQWASLEHPQGQLPQVTRLDKHLGVILQDWFKGEEIEMKTPYKDTTVVYTGRGFWTASILDKIYYMLILLTSLSPSIHAWSTEDQTLG